MPKSVDVIIPTYRPGKEFRELVKRLLAQEYPVDHIFIMNTGEENWDERIGLISDKVITEHIQKKEFDHGGTRHRAILKSSADIVICMTQDAMPKDRSLVGCLVGPFDEEGVKASYARQLPAQDCKVIERFTREFNYPEHSRIKWKEDLQVLGIKTYFCSNVCAAYDRKTYLELGGFVRHTIFNEDMIFAAGLIRRGYAVAYAADARVVHSHNYSGLQQLHRNFDLAVSQAQHPEIFADVPSEGEGIRMVKQTAGYLFRKRPYLIPKLVWQSGCKYLGFWLGRRYECLPGGVVMKLTMNRDYWRQNTEK
ncbi:glycosyltransferase family 2 protein [Ruminococcus sp. OA3]|uniref:glycosyltransferase n=1 Tax=Ruminococcus sp. OA3 TaxID=2914164 RepID=UPI001F052DD3|nr:glycosyltransferase family 2 protein [Ruminococcus sp. OA3]MCH1982206.1 glycosyltransferase family 2 protein [Ruminococcus sp. OA3]